MKQSQLICKMVKISQLIGIIIGIFAVPVESVFLLFLVKLDVVEDGNDNEVNLSLVRWWFSKDSKNIFLNLHL